MVYKYKYCCYSGSVLLGEVTAISDSDFREKMSGGNVAFYLPMFFSVFTDNPFSKYGHLKDKVQ